MGRPLTKRFFGNTNPGGLAGDGVASVTIAGTNNAYTTRPAVSFAAPALPGGVTALGTANMGLVGATIAAGGTGYTALDVVTIVGTGALGTAAATIRIDTVNGGGTVTGITVLTAGNYTQLPTNITTAAVSGGTGTLATFALTFKVNSITVGTAGSGYDAVPAVTIAGNATGTAVLATTSEPAIIAFAYTGSGLKKADIVKQVGTRQYKIKTSDSTENVDDRAVLKAATAAAIGEMTITGYDAAGDAYWITKLTRHKAVVMRATGTVFADGAVLAWTFGTADANTVKLQSA